MQGPRIVVVSDARPVRETLRVLLASRGRVVALSTADFSSPATEIFADDLLLSDVAPQVIWSALAGRCPAMPAIVALVDAGSGTLPVSAPFDPVDLIRRVDLVLVGRSRVAATEDMLLPAAARDLAMRLPHVPMPWLVLGEAGSGKRRAAELLAHRLGAALRIVDVRAPSLADAVRDPDSAGRATVLYASPIEHCCDGLRAGLAEIAAGGAAAPRLVLGSRLPFPALQALYRHDPLWFMRMSTVTTVLPALRERSEEIPALLAAVALRIGQAGAETRFDAGAVARLRDYLWFGNLVEFEAVVGRTILLSDGATVGADDIRFIADEFSPPSGAVASSPVPHEPAEPEAAPLGDAALAMLITELAHEFKNPMVVVKTGTQQIERGAEPGSTPAELAKLTTDAVDRMDRVLENLMQYSRFQQAERREVAVTELLASCLHNLGTEVAEKRIAFELRTTPARLVDVDPLQLAYAGENLLRVVVRDSAPGATVVIRDLAGRSGYAVEMPLASRGVSRKLAATLASGGDEGTHQPLGMRIAQDLVARSGGALRIGLSGDRQVIEVELPGGRGVGKADEEAPRFDS